MKFLATYMMKLIRPDTLKKDGYFTNDDLMKQVEKSIDIFERVHPDAVDVFLIDNAPSHRKMADDADKMNVGSSGKQAVMRDTIWGGEVQNMVDENGIPKGMKVVLEKRGVETGVMEMRELLKTF